MAMGVGGGEKKPRYDKKPCLPMRFSMFAFHGASPFPTGDRAAGLPKPLSPCHKDALRSVCNLKTGRIFGFVQEIPGYLGMVIWESAVEPLSKTNKLDAGASHGIVLETL